MLELKEQMEAYLEAIGPMYGKATVRAYAAGLHRFECYAAEAGITSASEVTERTLGAYHFWLLGFSFSESPVGLGVRAAKGFLQWAQGSGLTLYDGGSYTLKKSKSKAPEPPTVEVMKRLMTLPNRKTPEGLRDLFLLELLYGLGLRRKEASLLELEWLNLENETLQVSGKYGDARLLPVSPHLKSVAQRYLFNARLKLLPDQQETALLLNNEGRRLPTEAISYIVKKYGALLDLRLSPHALRHACATHLMEAGMRLSEVQRLLGHRTINSTHHYAQVARSELEREFHRVHPRARNRSHD